MSTLLELFAYGCLVGFIKLVIFAINRFRQNKNEKI